MQNQIVFKTACPFFKMFFLQYNNVFLNLLDSSRIRGEQFLVRWAIPQLHDIDALSRMVDPALNGEYPAKSLSNFADIIARCVQVSVITVDFYMILIKSCYQIFY